MKVDQDVDVYLNADQDVDVDLDVLSQIKIEITVRRLYIPRVTDTLC